jgi:hypothetical protein
MVAPVRVMTGATFRESFEFYDHASERRCAGGLAPAKAA